MSLSRSLSSYSTLSFLLLALVAAGAFLVGPVLAGSAHSNNTTPARPGDEVVARVGGQAITRADLEEHASASLRQLENQRHRILEASLDQLLEDRLLELEAGRKGLTADALLDSEVKAKAGAVTDAEVDAFFQENQARIRQPKEAVAAQIRQYLDQQRGQQARQNLLDELRHRHGVRVLLEPLRLEVASSEAPVKGPSDAPITIVEFSDFQCPACKRINPILKQVQETYEGKVRVAFRQLPLHSIHPQAQKAAEAALCAQDQGKFWEMHDSLFARQGELGLPQLEARAAELGLDTEAFGSCLNSDRHRETVMADVSAAGEVGLSGTPSLFVNGRPIDLTAGAPLDLLTQVIDQELERTRLR